jgi:hypothetical protein
MIEHGNAHADGAPFGHWFIGDLSRWAQKRGFTPEPGTLRQTSDVEIKWGFHPTGEQRVDWAACGSKRTLSVLVRGRFLLRFRSPDSRETVTELRLSREGDYAIWGTSTEHTWIVEEDAVILTVRWTEATA